MRLQFCGAAREVTGSAHLITLDNGFKILLDCGLYQGGSAEMESFNRQWYFKPEEINCLVLSHAHIDHSGRIPVLVKDGFKGSIFSTPATRDLCAIMLLDSAGIQERDAEYEKKKNKDKVNPDREQESPLYTIEDVSRTMRLFVNIGYERWFNIGPDVEVLFRDAGHILGSASVTLRITENGKTTTFGFSGDIGRPNRPILGDPLPMPELDYLICESTYGDRDHLTAPDEVDKFLGIVRHTCVEKRGKVIIPAFSVGRTQEIVYMLDKLSAAGKLPPIPVYVDSPLSVNATQVFIDHPECFDDELNRHIQQDADPFGFNSLFYIRTVEESKALNFKPEPCIIISSSGMANAGRIKHHLANNIENPNNTVLIVGYCTPETPGGKLRDGQKSIKLFGEFKMVNASVEVMDSFSAHADRGEIMDFIANQKDTVKQIFLVHGTYDRQEPLRQLMLSKGFKHVAIPTLGEEVSL
jgi:metallo-beta-lactamase family protein